MENITFKQKMIYGIKKYGYYILLGVVVLATVITLVCVSASKKVPDNSGVVPTSTVTPYMPVMNATIYKDYHGDELTYNATLKQWETHNGIDFQVASGSNVYSILDGVVTDVYNNLLEGTVVVVSHDNGLESTYGSLDSNLAVKTGQKLNRGDIIGTVSESAYSEADAGAHLHFSMTDNDQKIDPAAYLNISSK